jgi:GNAT superfamily N-acetyltransferase
MTELASLPARTTADPTVTPEIQFQVVDNPRENPDVVRRLAAFTLSELYGLQHPSEAELNEQVENMNTATTAFGVDSRGEVVASASYSRSYEPGEAELLDVVTRSGHQGSGLGRQVVAGVEDAARDKGIHTMTVVPLHSAKGVDSTGFYERLGYQRLRGGRFSRLL